MSSAITAWAAFATQGYPSGFISVSTVRRTRGEVQEYMGDTWRLVRETPEQGWKRAYRAGWRCIKVTVTAL